RLAVIDSCDLTEGFRQFDTGPAHRAAEIKHTIATGREALDQINSRAYERLRRWMCEPGTYCLVALLFLAAPVEQHVLVQQRFCLIAGLFLIIVDAPGIHSIHFPVFIALHHPEPGVLEEVRAEMEAGPDAGLVAGAD